MGRRRRYRSQAVCPSARSRDELIQARKSAIIAKEKENKLIESVKSSDGVKTATLEKTLECNAFLKNLPKSMAASEVVQFLHQRIGCQGEILRCQIHTDASRQSIGNATVTFKSSQSYQAARDLFYRGVRMQGNVVGFRERRGAFHPPKRSDYIQRFPVVSMNLCVGDSPIDSLEPSIIRWSSSNQVSFHINARQPRQVSIEFDSQFRLEFALNNISNSRILHNSEGQQVFRMRLRQPPHIFIRDASLSQDTNPGMLSVILRGMKMNKNIWEYNHGSAGSSSYHWERTIDPSRTCSFGHCLVYELHLGDSHLDLLKVLGEYSIKPPVVEGTMPEGFETETLICDGNWTGGYDDIFEHVPFNVGYMVHTAIASNKICLRDRIAAERLCEAITNSAIPQEVIIEILEDWYLEHHLHAEKFEELLERLRPSPTEPVEILEMVEPDLRVHMYTRRILITPLRVVPLPVDLDTSNRVLRQFRAYRDRFLRVTFCDENYGSVMQVVRSPDVMERRIQRFVTEGVVIAGRRFIFLAYSNSQLREQSCWMYDEDYRDDRDDETFPTAAQIRNSIGDLSHIPVVGKHAARLAQAFSSTTSTVSVDMNHQMAIDDVRRNNYVFSDGVGVISPEMARRVTIALGLQTIPSAFQIRYGGCKGVVSVRPTGATSLPKLHLLIRKSMFKFAANEKHNNLEICSHSKAMPCNLNRQIITILSSNGIPDKSFMIHADAMIRQLDHAMSDNKTCREMVIMNAPGSVADHMLNVGIGLNEDRHLWELVQCLRDRLLLDLQTKARIFVPDAICLVGIMDETDTLAPDEVFFQRSEPQMKLPPGTRVAIGRSPCLHPGDIRVMVTTDCPGLANLFDVIVFSQKGDRPRPNMMSGGDLDGDIYFIIWDPTLVPERCHDPMDYKPPAAPIRADTKVDITHIQDFFVNYMKNDNLGRIANAHVVFADRAEEGAESSECRQLAEMHSIAVDFGKTGVPAVLPYELIPNACPDFMENHNKPSYESRKVLGRIYRKSRGKQFKTFQPENNGLNPRFIISGHEDFLDEAQVLYDDYCWALWDIATRFEVYAEGELVTGWCRQMTKKLARTRDVGGVDNVQQLQMLVEDMQGKYLDAFWNGLNRDITNPAHLQRALCKVSAWYKIAYSNVVSDKDTKPFLSFPWVPTAVMCALVQEVSAA